ncbi:hypothetical protein XI06_15080 [Bradyrhizobium sp. CCBAU 11434]|uniref:hypothetical protein n=1 Tax=Bradyrhizobium sp. CCBAU 11434 TaxID=1630885 RepID=UPI0023051367|nr:hypothetical protein [Bradyrhizobium sp. CCBAU 11434]MDA9521631.1 hypothetical protein [Bradyrhizobium sp. CCBAU 11434]
MTEYVYVRPQPGGRVRMPDRNFMPMDAKGATVPRIDYYERLIITKDLEVCDPPAEEPEPVIEEASPVADSGPMPVEESQLTPRAPRSTKEK